jgi:lambda family phage tail tape measure protein
MASLTYAVDVQTSGAISSLASLQKQITGIGTAAVAAGAVTAGAFALTGIVNTTRELEELRGAFTTVTGDAARSAAEFDRVRELSMQLGTSQRALSETYVKLANSGIKPTNGLLTTLVDVSKNSTDQFGALTAAADLFSRTVSGGLGLEDLNRLQDRGIPVFKILQDQLGLSRLEIAKFGKTAEGAEKIRQALYKGFNEQFGGTSVRELTSINSQLMVFETLSNKAQESFGKGLVEAIGKSVGTVGELGGEINALAEALGKALGGAIVFVIDNLNTLIAVVGTFASAWAAVKLFELAKGVMAMVSAFKALTVVMIANPIGLIAAGVAALVAGFVVLVQETGSVSNALKTLGNAGIAVVNKLVNIFASYAKFMGHLWMGIGKAILAGLNPFSDKTAMGEIQAGMRNALGAVQKQMASNPISFRFKLDPVATKARPKLDLNDGGYQLTGQGRGAGGSSEASKKAVEDSKKIAEQMREQSLAAGAVTQELIAQNAATNEMRELEISLIGMASEQANLIKSNAQAKKQAAEEIRVLEAKIVEEQAKGKSANQEVLAQLQLQIVEKEKQRDATIQLNQVEYQRTQELEKQKLILESQLADIKVFAQFQSAESKKNLRDQMLLGKLSKEQYDRQVQLLNINEESKAAQAVYQAQIDAEIAKGEKADQNKIAALKEQQRQAILNGIIQTGNAEEVMKEADAITKSSKAGIRSAIENAKRITEPFYMAEAATASLFSNMNSALDNFVETGKFKFGSFAKSVIADLAKIALKAAATKLITSIFGAGIFGKAAGGPVMANKPYVVGEQGPELFVPNSAGSIMTNASLNKNAGAGTGMGATVNNTYITNNISAIDSRSVAQMFVENRKSLLGASMMARKEMPYGG